MINHVLFLILAIGSGFCGCFEKDIYAYLPCGFNLVEGADVVLKLKMSIYEVKQGVTTGHDFLKSGLQSCGFDAGLQMPACSLNPSLSMSSTSMTAWCLSWM